MLMRYPKFLPEGGTIGLIAPSFGCTTEPYRSLFESALDSFRDMGYTLSLGPNCYADCGIGISNTPEACAKEFMDYYLSGENDILLSCGGGEEMCEILPHIDFGKIRKAEPKLFCGFSDNTNLVFLLTTLCDVAAVYAPNAATYGMEPWHPSLTDAMEVLTGKSERVHGYDLYEAEGWPEEAEEENPLLPYRVTEPVLRSVYPEAERVNLHGRLLGGCLDCLVNLCGTRYDRVKEFNERYAKDGVLWYLEACDLNVFDIRRALWHLREAGWFDRAKGFLIGRPKNGGEIFGLTHERAVRDMLEGLHVPILTGLDIGHIPPMMPLICGSLADVEFRGGDIRIRMKKS